MWFISGLPKLITAPSISNITCDNLTITWYEWDPTRDIGDAPIGTYRYFKYYSPKNYVFVINVTMVNCIILIQKSYLHI